MFKIRRRFISKFVCGKNYTKNTVLGRKECLNFYTVLGRKESLNFHTVLDSYI